MEKTEIYIGLGTIDGDPSSEKEKKLMSVLRNVCKAYHTPFSFYNVNGGWFYEDGNFGTETTVVLTLMDVDHNIVTEIAKDICSFFNQESVLVVRSNAECEYISERILPE